MRWLAAVALIFCACKGNPEKCDKACRNYAELVYWDKAEAEIAAAPMEKRDALRKDKLAKFTADLEHGINMCTSQCTSATTTSEKQADCMIKATTAREAKDCSSE